MDFFVANSFIFTVLHVELGAETQRVSVFRMRKLLYANVITTLFRLNVFKNVALKLYRLGNTIKGNILFVICNYQFVFSKGWMSQTIAFTFIIVLFNNLVLFVSLYFFAVE